MRTRQPHRTIHLIDVENLAGEPRPSAGQIDDVRKEYETAVRVGSEDHVVVAVNHGAAREVGWTWPGRLIPRSGPDGADLALIDVLSHETVAHRFDEVVIASGDRIFAPFVAGLTRAGTAVRVVSRPESLSRRLFLAGGRGLVALTFSPAPQDPRSAVGGEAA